MPIITNGIQRVFNSAINVSDDLVQRDPLGAVRFEGDGRYKYVKFTGTTAVAVGDFVCYAVASDGFTETVVDGANSALPAGVAEGVHSLGAVTYGWIKVQGLSTLSTALAGTPAAGDLLTSAGATAPAVTKKTAVAQVTIGMAYNVAAKQVVLNVPY